VVSGWLLAGTAFLASGVEAIEALTIVLAVGFTRSWRASLGGAAWGAIALLAVVVLLGPAIVTFVPLALLKVVGTFLLLFGMSWLRKAILRYSGRKALKDENAAYARKVAALQAGAVHGAGPDRVAFATSFNAVLLEGLEVAVIVLTFGTSAPDGFWWSGGGAIAAVVLVAAAGFAVRKPFGRIPENAMKFVVGIMLTSFGTLWCGEGLGIAWWFDDLSLLWIVAAYLAASALAIAVAKRTSVVVTA
jgi:uncharacterized membrane protein